MRAKKVILCVSANEAEMGAFRYTLATHAYRVLPAQDARHAIEAFDATQVDLVLTEANLPGMNGAQLVEALKKIAAHVPMILLDDGSVTVEENTMADTTLKKQMCAPVMLLDRIKTLCARKRGPRPGRQAEGRKEAQRERHSAEQQPGRDTGPAKAAPLAAAGD